MDDPDLDKTIERLRAEDPELARTLVKQARKTLLPGRGADPRAVAALDELRALGASLHERLALGRTLGEGGMGVVHLATQATMGRHVAVKTLRAGAGDVEATLRILREAWVTGALEHPNVVPVYDVGVDAGGSPVIVMKRIEGREWAELLHAPAEIAKRFSAFDALEWNLRILASVCNAVHFAHSRGIVHRDLKPENVMIGAFGEVYVLDWGLAVSTRDDPSGRLPLAEHATEIAGTPCYMAPEMLTGGGKALTARTDVYLLGAILYEIFAGAPPHDGPTTEALFASVLRSSPKFSQGFPADARAICEKAMRRDPEERYASADELRVAVDAFLRHRGSRKLAWDAKRSLTRLLHVIEYEPAGEDRTLAVFNLLGECRFGYRAALSAWPENEGARMDLDRALLAVIEHELAGGDAHAGATLLREVSAPPLGVAARVEAAVRARADQEARAHKLEVDHDPQVGTRTRMFIMFVFGIAWTLLPITGWVRGREGIHSSHTWSALASAGFLALGVAAFLWARETLTKTRYNRRLALTLGVQLFLQIVLSAGAALGGLSPQQGITIYLFSWSLAFAMVAVWAEAWFAVAAVLCALSFLAVSARPDLLYPLMTVDNLTLTVLVVRLWFPRDDLAKMKERRAALRRRARKWLEETYAPEAEGDRKR